MHINDDTLEYLKSGIGEEGVQELIDLYFSTSAEIIYGLKLAIESSDFKKVSFWGHRLKGASSTLGFENIQAAAETMETAGHDCDKLIAQKTYNEIIPLYTTLETDLKSTIKRAPLEKISL